MFRILFWVRRKDGMTPEAFRGYWLDTHTALVRRTYGRLHAYEVHLTTGVFPRGEPLFDGIAELAWASREDFDADTRGGAAAVMADVPNFASASGTVFVETEEVVG